MYLPVRGGLQLLGIPGWLPFPPFTLLFLSLTSPTLLWHKVITRVISLAVVMVTVWPHFWASLSELFVFGLESVACIHRWLFILLGFITLTLPAFLPGLNILLPFCWRFCLCFSFTWFLNGSRIAFSVYLLGTFFLKWTICVMWRYLKFKGKE